MRDDIYPTIVDFLTKGVEVNTVRDAAKKLGTPYLFGLMTGMAAMIRCRCFDKDSIDQEEVREGLQTALSLIDNRLSGKNIFNDANEILNGERRRERTPMDEVKIGSLLLSQFTVSREMPKKGQFSAVWIHEGKTWCQTFKWEDGLLMASQIGGGRWEVFGGGFREVNFVFYLVPA